MTQTKTPPARLTGRRVPGSTAGRPAMRVFTDKDGLPQNTIEPMVVDHAGYLWIGTQDGAARYNGRVWTIVERPSRMRSNYIRALLVCADNSIVVGTDGDGIAHLRDGRWTTHDTSSGLPDDHVRCLLETRGDGGERALWVGTNGGGLARLERGRWTVFDAASGLPDNVVRCLLETVERDGTRTLWVGTGRGLARLDRGRWIACDAASGAPRGAVLSLCSTSDADGETTLWVGTDRGAIARVSRSGSTLYDEASGLPGWHAWRLAVASFAGGREAILAGTNGGGLAVLEGDRWRVVDSASGLPNNQVLGLLATSRGGRTDALWLGTHGGGLARVEVGQWTSFTAASGLPNAIVMSFLETESDDGSMAIWLGTHGGGLARLDRDGWTVFDTSTGLPNNRVWCLLATKGETGARALWIGTQGGLVRVEGDRYEVFDTSTGLPHAGILCLLETASEGGGRALWVGTHAGGLARFEGGAWTVFDAGYGLPDTRVSCLLETRDRDGARLLLAGTTLGLVRFDGSRWTAFKDPSGPNTWVDSIHEAVGPRGRRTLWVGTQSSGVAYADLDEPVLRWTWLSDSTTPALPNNSINEIREDHRGRIYLMTNRGVARLTKRTPTRDDASDFDVYTFTVDNGLPSNECNARASMVDSRGRIWVGTTAGAAVFDPAEEIEDRTQKPLYVERVLLDGRERRLRDGEALAHDENNLVFEVALLSYFREGDTRYRTQLAGFDREPSPWTASHQRVYTNLPEGRYRFAVWGRDSAGNVSGPVYKSFRIKPAPWKTWWAYLLYAGSAAGLGYAGIRYRLDSLRRRSEALEATVAARTAELADTIEQLQASEQAALEASRAKSVFLSNMSHELRTPLNAVLGFAQLMERDRERDAGDRESLAIIRRSGEHLLGLINDVLSISKIEAGKLMLAETVFSLPRLLRAVHEMIRLRAEARDLFVVFDLAPSLPAAVRGDEGKLRQVLINLLGNAVKFTHSGGVTLRARWADGRAAFEIEDTGQGIAEDEIGKLFEAFVQAEAGRQSTEGTGLGLVISQTIVRVMGGEVRVRSRVGRGTVFSFEVDLPLGETGVSPDERRVVRLAPDQEAPRVLIADDIAENRIFMARLLESAGFDVREASDGAEAVEVWRVWRPRLIWMDMRMPVMDGLEATRAIREQESGVGGRGSGDERGEGASPTPDPRPPTPCKIIAITASAFEHERGTILAGGADDFVRKPVRDATVFEKMAVHLGVRYIYEDERAGAAREPRSAGAESGFVAARLGGMARTCLDELERAASIGDVEEARAIVDRIGERDAALAVELRAMVRSYRFDELLEVLRTRGQSE